MEQFTRECLQVNTQPSNDRANAFFSRGAMERIYARAADLVKGTLDVEGACVMDVSRSGLHEPTSSSEGQLSITLYDAESKTASDTRILSAGDYLEVVMFFSKQPDGVVVENQLPVWLRDILPKDILHALSEN